MDSYDKVYDILQTNKRFKLKMAMKKPTKSDIKAGRVYRCENCDAFCTDLFSSITQCFEMGRPTDETTDYYCTRACANKHSRDGLRTDYEENIKDRKESETVLKEVLQRYILKGKKSKTLFQAIKMVRQDMKTLTMLLSGEYALHIMKVEFFKVSEAAMDLAELIAEEEDPEFCNEQDECTEYEAQSTAMWARTLAEDKYDTLSLWFN